MLLILFPILSKQIDLRQYTQNYWVSGPCPSSGILNATKHNFSKTGSVSALGRRERDIYSIEAPNLDIWNYVGYLDQYMCNTGCPIGISFHEREICIQYTQIYIYSYICTMYSCHHVVLTLWPPIPKMVWYWLCITRRSSSDHSYKKMLLYNSELRHVTRYCEPNLILDSFAEKKTLLLGDINVS
jgi:hypothetical protein